MLLWDVCVVSVFASCFLYRCQVCRRKGCMCNVLEFVLSCFSVSDFFVLSNFSGIVPSSRRLQECAIVKKQKELCFGSSSGMDPLRDLTKLVVCVS